MGGVRRYKDLLSWQLADSFKAEIYRLVLGNYAALHAWKYRDQILESAGAVPKDVSEGFIRYSPGQFAQFLTCGLASLGEAEEWLKGGVLRGYFTADEAALGLSLAKRAWMAMLRLKQSQDEEQRRRDSERRRRGSPRPPKPFRPRKLPPRKEDDQR
jgi:four helix bundle protein